MVRQLLARVKKERIKECQINAYLSFTYYQGCIDALIDVRDNIQIIKAQTKDTNNREIQ